MNRFFLLIFVSFVVSINSFADRIKVDDKTKKQLINVLEANELLHQSFFKYDSQKITINSKLMLKKMNLVSNKEISSMLNFAKKKLKEISGENKKSLNNQNYHIVSTAMIVIMNKYDLGKKYNSYSCPMVKKKWIQNTTKDDTVLNPYADYMPNCGRKETNY